MKNMKTELVVIGSGIAGFAAAVTAAEKGADVILLEKRKVVGGNSRFAAGMFSCKDTGDPNQLSVDEIYEKVLSYHRGQFVDPRIVRAYLKKSNDTARWLESYGLEYNKMGHGPNAGKPLTGNEAISFNNPLGSKRAGMYNAIQALHKRCHELGVQVFCQAAAKHLRKEDGRIVAVEAEIEGESVLIETKAAVIATGGFTGNKELLHKYFHYYNDDYEGHMLPHTGDGVAMAEEVGASLYARAGMVRETQRDWAPSWVHFPLIMAMRRDTIMAVNQKGQRVISETFISEESNMTCNILDQQPDQVIYAIYDEALMQEIDSRPMMGPAGKLPAIGDIFRLLSQEGKAAKVCDSIEELAAWIGADVETLRATIERYNGFCADGYDADFTKNPHGLHPIVKAPFYVLKVGPLMIDTVGPIRINEHMEVLDKNFDAIGGLYCAGVAAGGWSSDDYCARYQFGSCIGFSCNSGRIAGESALAYIGR